MRWVSDLDVGVTVEDFGHRIAVLIYVFTPHWSFGIYEPGLRVDLFSFHQMVKSDSTFSCVIIKFCLGVW